MQRRHLLTGLGAVSLAGAARAQALPSEIRVLVPFAAGGATDLLARRLQAILEPLGTKLLVENVTGGGSMVAMNRLAQSRPDGRTIGLASHGLIAQIAAGEIPLRLEQFAPLVRLAVDPSVMVVGARSPIRDMQAMLAALRRPPGPTIGAAGPLGTVGHLRVVGLGQEARGEFTYVGYPGASRVANELIGGHLDMGLVKPNDVFGQIRSGELRVVAILEEQRLPQMPDVPSITEAGLAAYPFGRMQLMTFAVAPAGMPVGLRDAMTQLLRDAVLSQPFQAKADEDAYLADGLSGEGLQDAIARSFEAIRTAQARARV
ncbi:MAG: tripartite tricarboxylate transporter substrate binding protein [Alphaproteobacteria bacterium]|nr:tripartite tricarboxylate transporter substrate binding protein [Alphaproteobacteria bacterium]